MDAANAYQFTHRVARGLLPVTPYWNGAWALAHQRILGDHSVELRASALRHQDSQSGAAILILLSSCEANRGPRMTLGHFSMPATMDASVLLS